MLKTIKHLKLALKPELIPADLASLLISLDPKNSYSDRMDALGQLMDWVRLPAKIQEQDETPDYIHARDVRIKFLFNFLERNPEEAKNLAAMIQELINPGSSVSLYCLTGLSENHGFIGELINRIIQRILPDAYCEKDLSEAFKVLFTEEEDAVWIEHSFKNIYPSLGDFIRRHTISIEPLKKDIQEAKIILAAQVATLGTSRDIRYRLGRQRLTDSSFLRLNAVINSETTDEQLLIEVMNARKDLGIVRDNLETSGVSVDLIFKLEKIHSILDRLEMLIYLGKEYGPGAPLIMGQLIGRLIRDELKSLGVKLYIKENLHLLTRKIVERSGEKGDYYIATTKEKKQKLFYAASLAGVLTGFTALFKSLIGIQPFPLFFEGFFYFANYALSFLIMQKWHLALSSKQPAYTAAALSRYFEDFKQTKDIAQVSSEIKKIAYSQFLATIGNLLWVIPTALIIDLVWLFSTGSHILEEAQGMALIYKHHLIKSPTLLYAALTGVLLWMSSVISGWVENWMVYREVPEALRGNSFMKKLVGKPQLNYIANHLAGTAGGIAGNLSISFLLTVPIIISKFTSIPMDIRHVTLSTGTLVFAFSSLNWNIEYWDLMLMSITSIIVIGTLNFSVSFYCALRMAALARNLETKFLKKIFFYAFNKKKTSPR